MFPDFRVLRLVDIRTRHHLTYDLGWIDLHEDLFSWFTLIQPKETHFLLELECLALMQEHVRSRARHFLARPRGNRSRQFAL
jgi:hypothetical protein